MYDYHGDYFDIEVQDGRYVCIDEDGDSCGSPTLFALYCWDQGIDDFDSASTLGYVEWIQFSEASNIDVFDDIGYIKSNTACIDTWDSVKTGLDFKKQVESLINQYGSLYDIRSAEWLALYSRFNYEGHVENDVVPQNVLDSLDGFSFGMNTDLAWCGEYEPQLNIYCQNDADYSSEESKVVAIDLIFDEDEFASQLKEMAYDLVANSNSIVDLFESLGKDQQEEFVNDYFQIYNPNDAAQYLRLTECVLANEANVNMNFGSGSLFEKACNMIGNDPDSVYESLEVGVPLEDILA